MVFLPIATTLAVPKYLDQGRNLIGNIIEQAVITSIWWLRYGAESHCFALIMVSLVTLMKN